MKIQLLEKFQRNLELKRCAYIYDLIYFHSDIFQPCLHLRRIYTIIIWRSHCSNKRGYTVEDTLLRKVVMDKLA